VKVEANEAAKALKKIPANVGKPRENIGLRLIKMNAPICPHSQIRYEWDVRGKAVRVPPTGTNCQRRGGKWWLFCQEQGHDPYFSTVQRTIFEDVLGEPDEQGRREKIGRREFVIEDRVPNVAAVAVASSLNSGRGYQLAVERKGRRPLREAGFQETCQFSSCQEEVDPEFLSREYGAYCSARHLELVVMREEGTSHWQPGMLGV
jgi:hypothetical protein